MAPPQSSTWSSRILRFRRVRQALALSLLAAVAISAAFLLTPSRFTPAIPGDEALGTPFAGTLKANRDYDVRDPETTAEKREERTSREEDLRASEVVLMPGELD